MTIKFNNKRGLLLFFFMIMLGLLTLAGVAMSKVFYEIKLASSQSNAMQARYMSYAGINKAMYYLTNTATQAGSTTDGSWRTSAYPAAAGTCSTIVSGSTYYPCQEVVSIGNGYGAYTMWVEETSNYDLKITAVGKFPTDSSGNSIAGTVTKTYQVTTKYKSYLENWFKFSEGKGQSIVDSSSSGNYMRMNGTATWTSSGKIGYGLDISATYLIFIFSNSPRQVIVPAFKAFTMAVWVYCASIPATRGPLLGSKNSSWGMYIRNVGGVGKLAYFDGKTQWHNGTATISCNNTTWTHVAITYDGTPSTTAVKLYVNGAPDALTTGLTVYGLPDYTSIGGDGGGFLFPGIIDDARFYNRVLSAAEIDAIYDAGTDSAANDAAVTPWGYMSIVPGSWTQLQ